MYDSIQMYENLLYLLVYMRTVIGQFYGLYPTVRPVKFKVSFLRSQLTSGI